MYFGFGVYAAKTEKPMFFWAGVDVSAREITDIKAYNKENSRMWKIYSIPWWIMGVTFFCFPIFTVVFLSIYSVLGTVFLVCRYHKIENKYRKN